jgi:hypothetical protein
MEVSKQTKECGDNRNEQIDRWECTMLLALYQSATKAIQAAIPYNSEAQMAFPGYLGDVTGKLVIQSCEN